MYNHMYNHIKIEILIKKIEQIKNNNNICNCTLKSYMSKYKK